MILTIKFNFRKYDLFDNGLDPIDSSIYEEFSRIKVAVWLER